jgi:hypothetical protein
MHIHLYMYIYVFVYFICNDLALTMQHSEFRKKF